MPREGPDRTPVMERKPFHMKHLRRIPIREDFRRNREGFSRSREELAPEQGFGGAGERAPPRAAGGVVDRPAGKIAAGLLEKVQA